MPDPADAADFAQQMVEPTEILMQRGLSKAANGRADGEGNISRVLALSVTVRKAVKLG
jgi:hypothetical protein